MGPEVSQAHFGGRPILHGQVPCSQTTPATSRPQATGYKPADDYNWLKNWNGSATAPPEIADLPVTLGDVAPQAGATKPEPVTRELEIQNWGAPRL